LKNTFRKNGLFVRAWLKIVTETTETNRLFKLPNYIPEYFVDKYL